MNLIGEHVDYNGGAVLPPALPHRVEVAVAPRGDGLLRVHFRRYERWAPAGGGP